MAWVNNVCIAIDQLANALAGGNPDLTISARVGYRIAHHPKRYWAALAAVIDYTFRPLDGKNHCLNSYYADQEDYTRESGSDIARAILAIVVIAACFMLLVPIRVLARWK